MVCSSPTWARFRRVTIVVVVVGLAAGAALVSQLEGLAAAPQMLSASFTPQVLRPVGSDTPGAVTPEAKLELRLFDTSVKTDSQGNIIKGPTADPVKNLVGEQSAGTRAGIERFTRIMFGANFLNGQPDPGQRIDPNNVVVGPGDEHWPHIDQPFRGWPTALALTPDGSKLYVSLPGRDGYPDWRVAVVDTATRRVLTWVDLRGGQSLATHPAGLAVSPLNTAISARPYVVALNEYANFASVIDTGTDALIGEFEAGFFAEKAVFNKTGTRLYISERANPANGSDGPNGRIHAFSVTPGPTFTKLADIPTGSNALESSHPRDMAISSDGNTLYVANTLGNRVAQINIANDANQFVKTLLLGGLATDVKVAGRWGIVSGHETNNCLNQPETGHGLPAKEGGTFVKNSGAPLGYLPVMSDCTQATTFDDIGTELNIFDTATNQFVFRYVDGPSDPNGRCPPVCGRSQSMLVSPGAVTNIQDCPSPRIPNCKELIRGSGAEQMFVAGNLLFVSQLHSDKVEVFHINPAQSSGDILSAAGIEYTGGITPQGVVVSPDGKTVYVANMQTEDISFLGTDASGNLTRQGVLPVGVTPSTPDPTTGGNGQGLFSTHEEVGLRWFFTQSYSDDGQKSCGFCHWQSRHDGAQWNVGANAIGGVKISPQNKDLSDTWPEWFEGNNNDFTAYASACNGELTVADRPTALFPQADETARFQARDQFVLQETAANSTAIGRSDLSGQAFSIGYYDMAERQILWSQNETRRLPNPLSQFPTGDQAAKIARGKFLFTAEVDKGGSGCASCHQNGDPSITTGARTANGTVVNDTTQDWMVYEPGVIADTTVDNDGPFTRLSHDYFFQQFGPTQDVGGRQNISSRNTKHLRSMWDSVPRWLHHGDAHSLREVLLPPDSPLLKPGERGFNFRVERTDAVRREAHDYLGAPPVELPVEVPITFADSTGDFAGDGKGPIYVSLDPPTVVCTTPDCLAAYPDGRLEVDQLGTSNLAPLVLGNQINPALAANNVRVIKDTHGKTSQLTAADIEALSLYLESLQ